MKGHGAFYFYEIATAVDCFGFYNDEKMRKNYDKRIPPGDPGNLSRAPSLHWYPLETRWYILEKGIHWRRAGIHWRKESGASGRFPPFPSLLLSPNKIAPSPFFFLLAMTFCSIHEENDLHIICLKKCDRGFDCYFFFVDTIIICTTHFFCFLLLSCSFFVAISCFPVEMNFIANVGHNSNALGGMQIFCFHFVLSSVPTKKNSSKSVGVI
jgi:hypothetical protein